MSLYCALAIVDPPACRERPAEPYVAARAGAAAFLPRTEEAARRADALARSLCAARDRLTVPFARIAASLVRERAWCAFGFARATDFTREHLGRSGRWLRDLAALHQALSALDGLGASLTGDDGGAPLGRRRALLVSRVATQATLSAWIDRARRLTVRELQEAVSQARLAGDALPAPDAAAQTPEADSAPAPEFADAQDDEDRTLVTLATPRAVIAAFDEAVDLYRAVEGQDATVTFFVEAVVGEAAAAGNPPPDASSTRSGPGPAPAVIEASLARSTDRWRHLPRSTDASWGLALGHATLARLAVIARAPDDGGPAERLARMKELLVIENDLEIHLGRLLASMGEQDAWNRLRFAGIAHYAEERLGMSRTAAQSRARAARLLGRFPLLRTAYERDSVGLEATLLLGRILCGGDAASGDASVVDASAADAQAENPATTPAARRARSEEAWVRHAAEVTFKRLRDESRALDRTRAFGLDSGPDPRRSRAPLADADWHDSLRRAPGTARRRVAALGLIALGVRPTTPDAAAAPTEPAFCPATALIPEPDVFLRLTLPDELAAHFLAAVEHARQSLAEQVESIPWDADWPGPAVAATPAAAATRAPAPTAAAASTAMPAVTPALLAARTFSIRSRRVPAWVGLLALIEDFVATWDPDEIAADVSDDPILVRDGWRCAAPGCSSRRNLEVHHVIYRSRGGGDEDWNRVALCRFHHQRGEHGGLARCTGRAPLGLTWRLGAGEIASWYRNERRLRSQVDSTVIPDHDVHELPVLALALPILGQSIKPSLDNWAGHRAPIGLY